MTIRFGFSLTGRGALADRATITALAQQAEALGHDSVFVTDRMLIRVASTQDYPYSATTAPGATAHRSPARPLRSSRTSRRASPRASATSSSISPCRRHAR